MSRLQGSGGTAPPWLCRNSWKLCSACCAVPRHLQAGQHVHSPTADMSTCSCKETQTHAQQLAGHPDLLSIRTRVPSW